MFYTTVDLYDYFHIPRGENAGGSLTVYARSRNPENSPRIRPAILIAAGGGYNYLSFREGEPVALKFLAEGYAVFLLNYTICTPYPVPLIEAAMAMKYIRENAQTYAVDADRVCAAGFSAGGHLVGMLILSYPVITTGIRTHGDTANTISGGDPVLAARLSLEKRVTKESSPAFIWHTSEDDCVAVENAFLMAQAYRVAGVPFELHIFEKGGHGLSTSDIEVCNERGCRGDVEAVRMWIPLALNFLKARGFEVR